MKKLLLLPFFFILTSTISNAQWIELGTGADSLRANKEILCMTIDNSGNLYAGGWFTDTSGYVYVAKWNDTSWSQLGTGSNPLNTKSYVGINPIVADKFGNVYVADAGLRDTNGLFYVVKWDGASWSQLGTGPNSINANGGINSMAIDNAGNIYAGGSFTDGSGKYYVAKWDGTSWSPLGTGTNALNANNFLVSVVVDNAGNVYAAGQFIDGNSKYYVAKWNGTSWSDLGTGSSALNANAWINSLATDKFGNVYAAGAFTNTNSKYYVAQWNGTTWSELGTGGNALNANEQIMSVAVDDSGNVYAGGYFTNLNSKYYVAKWDGTSWSELGAGPYALNASDYIWTITVDDSANVYAAGNFKDADGHVYVAKYVKSGIITGVANSAVNNTILSVYPNPTNGNVTINTPETGQVTIYNSLGQIVTTETIQAGNAAISLGNVSTGVYTLILTGQNSTYTPIKIVKN